MLELKGKVLERIPEHKRERMERTLERMREVRRRHDMRLAKLVKAKKEWAKNEKQKGLGVIDQLEKQIEAVKVQLVKLDGCLLVLNELDEEAENMLKEDQKIEKE
jgi:hypothetical protein